MNYVSRPLEIEAFTFGTESLPLWWLQARRKNAMLLPPLKGTIVTKFPEGKIIFYTPETFHYFFKPQEIVPQEKKPRRKRRTRAEIDAAKADIPATTATVAVKEDS